MKPFPNLRFGRFTDSYKEEEKYQFWDQAIQSFEANLFLDSFEFFLRYLKDDDSENVTYERHEDSIEFVIFQGSKLMSGIAYEDRITAEVKIAETKSYNVGFLRKLISMNYGLKFSRYAIDRDGHITTVFNSSILDCSPYKLYSALKELALNADRQDDILTSEFEELESVNTGHLEEIDQNVKELKFQFLRSTLSGVKNILEHTKLDKTTYPGGVSYVLLSTAYKLDYLTVPEGSTMHKIEMIHQSFFSEEHKDPLVKNRKIESILFGLSEMKAEIFYKELYKIKSTFGVAAPSTHENLVNIIQGELSNLEWYLKNGYEEFALAIPMYVVGRSLYGFSLPAPDREFLELCYRVTDNDFFVALGYPTVWQSKNKLNRKQLMLELKEIKQKYQDQYQIFNPDYRTLLFDSNLFFVKSILEMVAKMKLEKNNSLLF